jgi:asparagine synthase (glutamine-hydrolysing)
VYNGEVYNFKELRKALIMRGHSFYTDTDTEVIVHLYEQEGIEGFERLNGMFAFALYDQRQKKLILSRDRIGIKPLYYSLSNGVVFASEMKALLALKNGTYNLNLSGVARYLAHDYTPGPDTVVNGILKLMPGTCLIKEQDRIYEKTFASVSAHVQNNIKDEKAEASRLEGLLSDSVRDQMVADVPVGVLLSGGIDSSTIAYFASKMKPDIKSFSISFDEPSFDEGRYAVLVSKSLGLRHYSAVFTFDVFSRLFDQLTDFMDEPVADPSLLPTYFLSKLAGEQVKVVLSGEGGDEMFAGYPTYIAHRFASAYNTLPAFLRKGIIEPFVGMLPVSSKNFSFDFIAKEFISSAFMPVHKRHVRWMAGFSDRELPLLFKDGLFDQIKTDVYKNAEVIAEKAHGLSDPAIANILDMLMYLPDDLLVKVDRSTMFASIESRVPLLDNRLVEFSMSLPFGYKVKGLTQKYILKRLMKGKLPDIIVNRKKKGFGIPLTKWLQQEFRHEAEALLSKDSIVSTGLFHYAFVDRLLKEHISKTYDHRKKLWPIIVLMKWLQKYRLTLP